MITFLHWIGRLCRSYVEALGVYTQLTSQWKVIRNTTTDTYYMQSLSCQESQQAGCSIQFRTYLRNKAIDKIPLAEFCGNRFNIFLYDADGVYFLKIHMLDYLTTAHGSLNLLLQAVSSDLQVPQYIVHWESLISW